MPYIAQTDKDRKKILEEIGAGSVEDLLKDLPEDSRLKNPLDLPKGLSEQELAGALKALSLKNSTIEEYSSFLGAGAYNHYIPSVVRNLTSRSEFYTSYTPYQPEVSQGTLQAIFEYQTLICQLTSMDVSNASLYDGATSVAEAVLMAGRITGRRGIIISSALHPEYRDTVKTYLTGTDDRLTEVQYSRETGATPAGSIEAALTDETACVVIQHPNFFGSLEEVEKIASIAHAKKALLIVAITEPLSLGLLKPPGESGCDIAVGEAQSFGNPLSYGGPYLGFMATKDRFVRQMPGRIVGQTVDKDGKRAFCLTLATREQHIRRERATSNICSNHGLCALAAAIHMISLGRSGMRRLAVANVSKAQYLKKALESHGIKAAFSSPIFNEFTIRLQDPEEALKRLLKTRIIGGLPLGRFYPELKDMLLVCATEMNSKDEMDRFAAGLKAAL